MRNKFFYFIVKQIFYFLERYLTNEVNYFIRFPQNNRNAIRYPTWQIPGPIIYIARFFYRGFFISFSNL